MLDRKILSNIPEKPGVYIFKKDDDYIYIGKAKNLKKRLQSHFSFKNEKSKLIINESNKLDTIVVKNEKEALLLEANMIFLYKPKYNVLLKESKPYSYIRISDDEFPYIEITRNKDNAGIYFGPYTNIRFIRSLLEFLQKIFGFRTCKKNLEKVKRPCIDYHLKKCVAPCVDNNISKEEYFKVINNVEKVLKGNFEYIKKLIEEKMKYHSSMLDFENAAKYRDLLFSFEELVNSQGVILNDSRNVDYIAFKDNVFLVLKVRSGVLMSKLIYEAEIHFEEFLYYFYYGLKSDLPSKIVTNNSESIDFDIEINEFLDDYDSYLLEIAEENLDEYLNFKLSKSKVLMEMKKILRLRKYPKRIEGTDISHRNGKFTVASLVVFEDGLPKYEEYRKYKLGDILDDYESIRKFIKKRYSKHNAPDLLFVDGGKGQVSAADFALKELGLDIDVVGIAKEKELIVTKDKVLQLSYDNEILRMLVKIRDETHRVANGFSQDLKLKNYKVSKLDSIKGIGPKRKKALLKKFGSIENIKKAPIEDLEKIVGRKLAQYIKKYI